MVTEPEKCRKILATKIEELKENMNFGKRIMWGVFDANEAPTPPMRDAAAPT